MACVSTALMIGGGIAGFSAAIALSRVGIRCDVVEIVHAPLGASLGISGRAAEALDELGVYDACYATGTPWTRDTKAGNLMDAAGNLIAPAPQRPEWPGAKTSMGVYRPTLMKILEEQAVELGVRVEKGVTATAIDNQDDAAVVTLSTGETRRYDLVVGADGISSQTRGILFPEAPKPVYAGQMSIRWMAPGPAIDPKACMRGLWAGSAFTTCPRDISMLPRWSARRNTSVDARGACTLSTRISWIPTRRRQSLSCGSA